MITSNLNTNAEDPEAMNRDGDLFFYMKRKNINLQCWSPFQYGLFKGVIFDNNEKNIELNRVLEELAIKYSANKAQIVCAFLFKLGENIQIISGSITFDHLYDVERGKNINLTHNDWYRIYKATGNKLP